MVITNIKQSILNDFNRLNKVKPAVQLTDINWSTPEVFLQGQCNTRITITGRPNSDNFEGSQTLYYVRRRISDDLKGITIPGKSTDYTRFYEVLAVLRDTMGVPLQDNEFLDRTISGPTLTIATTPVCLAYLPADQITLMYSE